MSSQRQTRPIRSMSAKTYSTRSRPISGLPSSYGITPATLKTQLITSVYKNKQKSPKRYGNKNISNPVSNTASVSITNPLSSNNARIYGTVPFEQMLKFKKSTSIGITKSREQLYQENIQLKRQLNRITEQHTILKSKIQTRNSSKKNLQKNKKLQIEFEKQVFWTGTKTHMIEGIKYQYEKLKKQFKEQNVKYNQLKVILLEAKLPQFKVYIEMLENQNKRLLEKINSLYSSNQFVPNNSINNNNQSKQVTKVLLAQLQQNNATLQKKLTNLDIELRNANQTIKDKENKILFLEKLIIEKDNRQYHIGRKLKKCQKDKSLLNENLEQMKNNLVESQRMKEEQARNLKIEHQKEKEKLEIKYGAEIRDRDQVIGVLKDQNRELENIVNRLRMSASNVTNTATNNINHNNSHISSVPQPPKTRKPQTSQQPNPPKQNHPNQLNNFQSSKSKDLQQSHNKTEQDRFRVVRRANKKHSQNSKKARKVQYHEIQHIGQILKYRMMNQNVDGNKMREYFNYHQNNNRQQQGSIGFTLQIPKNTNSHQSQWQNQYITMSQTQKILHNSPFNLDQESAYLLSRYIIEDCHEQYIYIDSQNQNSREIAKSIIKAVIGSYNLIKQQTIMKAKQFMDNYQTNLQSALRTYAPQGRVSKKKFVDTIKGLGVEVSEDICEYLLAKMLAYSKNTQQMEYKVLFQKVNRKL